MEDAVAGLRRSEERFRSFFDSAAVALWVSDLRPVQSMLDALRARGEADVRGYLKRHPDFVVAARRSVLITDVNESGLRLLQVTSKAEFFKRLSEFLPEVDDSFEQCILAIDEKRPAFTAVARLRASSGELIPTLVAINLPPVQGLENNIGVYTDLRERTRSEQELARARTELDQALRFASMGQLTASIAHEVNQPLSAVVNYAMAAQRWLDRAAPSIDEARPLIRSVVQAAQHASDVVKRVRSLLESGEPERSPADFDLLVTEAVRHATRVVTGPSVAAALKLHAEGRRVLADRVLIQQVVINLYTNAVQAVAHLAPDRRRVDVRTRVNGAVVIFEVEDSGPGYPKDRLERGFGPFQTTKRQGMGLGLVISRSTIEAHEGRLTLENAPHGGARASFTLPVWPPATSREPAS